MRSDPIKFVCPQSGLFIGETLWKSLFFDVSAFFTHVRNSSIPLGHIGTIEVCFIYSLSRMFYYTAGKTSNFALERSHRSYTYVVITVPFLPLFKSNIRHLGTGSETNAKNINCNFCKVWRFYVVLVRYIGVYSAHENVLILLSLRIFLIRLMNDYVSLYVRFTRSVSQCHSHCPPRTGDFEFETGSSVWFRLPWLSPANSTQMIPLTQLLCSHQTLSYPLIS